MKPLRDFMVDTPTDAYELRERFVEHGIAATIHGAGSLGSKINPYGYAVYVPDEVHDAFVTATSRYKRMPRGVRLMRLVDKVASEL